MITDIFMIIVLNLLQLAAGFGLLSMLKIVFRPGIFIALSAITGVCVLSLLPFLLQLLFIPITQASVFIAICIIIIVLNVKSVVAWKRLRYSWQFGHYRIRLYELPSLLLIAFIVFVSVWRCYYYPPFPRDLTSGAEVIAEYTVREKTMINSVFSVNLESTNNQFKPPYITSLQIIYKYAGLPFGQMWLSTIFISFVVFLYHILILRLHRLLAGLLLVFFIAIPEMYAYTFMALFDYSNAVFFCISVFFLLQYLEKGKRNQIILSGIMMGFATYARSETLVLAVMMIPVMLWHHIRNWDGFRKIVRNILFFMFPALLFYVVTVSIYIGVYLPVSYPIHNLVNPHPFNPIPFFKRFSDMNNQVIFNENGLNYFGYFFFIFLLVLLLDLILNDKWNAVPKFWLYTIIVVFTGLPFIGFLLPLYDLDHSTKRGLFKIFPLMLLYMGNCGILMRLSETIRQWESR